MTADRVEKRQLPEYARRELMATQAGQRIAQDCPFFAVPGILDHDADGGLIVFERVADVLSLRKFLPDAHAPLPLITRVADALAAIHSDGKPIPELGSSDFCHGDFTLDNVFYVGSSDQLYVFDWARPIWWQDKLEPNRYHDLALFVMSLFARPVFYRKGVKDVHTLASEFIAVYRKCAEFDAGRMKREYEALWSVFRPYSIRLNLPRFVANYPSTIRCRSFIHRIS